MAKINYGFEKRRIEMEKKRKKEEKKKAKSENRGSNSPDTQEIGSATGQ